MEYRKRKKENNFKQNMFVSDHLIYVYETLWEEK